MRSKADLISMAMEFIFGIIAFVTGCCFLMNTRAVGMGFWEIMMFFVAIGGFLTVVDAIEVLVSELTGKPKKSIWSVDDEP